MNFFVRLFGKEQPAETTAAFFGATDTGKVRKANEDYFLIDDRKKLFIAADGMGGHNAGEVASLHATNAINDYFHEDLLEQIRGNPEQIKIEMTQGLLYAHRKVIEMAKTKPLYKGMGCTVVVALIDGNQLHLCHVGDARAYVCKKKFLRLLTMDHSYVLAMVKKGKMTMEEARHSPIKNKIIQAIGVPDSIEPEYNLYQLDKGDRILLCSDGLWDMLSDSLIFKILSQKRKTPGEIGRQLIEKANGEGGRDNITVVVGFY